MKIKLFISLTLTLLNISKAFSQTTKPLLVDKISQSGNNNILVNKSPNTSITVYYTENMTKHLSQNGKEYIAYKLDSLRTHMDKSSKNYNTVSVEAIHGSNNLEFATEVINFLGTIDLKCINYYPGEIYGQFFKGIHFQVSEDPDCRGCCLITIGNIQ